jgi:hypothetical protein
VRVKGDKQEVRPLRHREEKKASAEVPTAVTSLRHCGKSYCATTASSQRIPDRVYCVSMYALMMCLNFAVIRCTKRWTSCLNTRVERVRYEKMGHGKMGAFG